MLNTIKGTWRNLLAGREMLNAHPADRVQEATKAFLRAAEGLLGAWGAYRAGKAPAAFQGPETAYLDASATLTEMHETMKPPKKLDGEGLLAERTRLASLAAFPDQDLIAPVMGAVKNRAAQIEAYASTPAGADKIADVERRRFLAEYDREQAERAEKAAALAAEERKAAERLRLERQQREDERLRPLLQELDAALKRAKVDPDVNAIMRARGMLSTHRSRPELAQTGAWRMAQDEIAALDANREAAPPDPDPAQDPQPGSPEPTQPYPKSRGPSR